MTGAQLFVAWCGLNAAILYFAVSSPNEDGEAFPWHRGSPAVWAVLFAAFIPLGVPLAVLLLGAFQHARANAWRVGAEWRWWRVRRHYRKRYGTHGEAIVRAMRESMREAVRKETRGK